MTSPVMPSEAKHPHTGFTSPLQNIACNDFQPFFADAFSQCYLCWMALHPL
jgi:hypothetical protein